MVQDNVGQTVDQLMARATFDADGNLKDWYMTGRSADILTLTSYGSVTTLVRYSKCFLDPNFFRSKCQLWSPFTVMYILVFSTICV